VRVRRSTELRDRRAYVSFAARKKVTIQTLHRLKAQNVPITVLTAYDFPTARTTEHGGVDVTLVGDSLAQVALGYPSTTALTLEEMEHHVRAVRRGCSTPFIVADMPFGSVGVSVAASVENAIRLVRAGAEAVKLEGGSELIETIRAMTSIGVPVMGHIGLLPQRAVSLSGYRVQGKDAGSAAELLRTARALQDAGAFSLVLEAIPSKLGTYVTESVDIPTIGIGAGNGTSGQVLVWSDAMGTWKGHKAKFVRRFANVHTEAERGIAEYVDAVRTRSFPDPDVEGYPIDSVEWQQFLDTVKTHES
jgi:3-methyl-2-oxobutanoate hydroxymethyltransferase